MFFRSKASAVFTSILVQLQDPSHKNTGVTTAATKQRRETSVGEARPANIIFL